MIKHGNSKLSINQHWNGGQTDVTAAVAAIWIQQDQDRAPTDRAKAVKVKHSESPILD